jgi:hypothetical protein
MGGLYSEKTLFIERWLAFPLACSPPFGNDPLSLPRMELPSPPPRVSDEDGVGICNICGSLLSCILVIIFDRWDVLKAMTVHSDIVLTCCPPLRLQPHPLLEWDFTCKIKGTADLAPAAIQ